MIPRAEIDIREFNRAIATLAKGSRQKAVHIANQVALDVAGEWFDVMPPPIGQINQRRREIRSYMQAVIGRRLSRKERKAGKHQLMRMHLIIQSRRRRAGLRGLYGDEMRRLSGRFSGQAQRSVGYLKVMLLPIIRGLNRVMRTAQASGIRGYVKRFAETGGAGGGRISIWPGSGGYGIVTPAAGTNPLAILRLQWNFHGPREGYARGLVIAGWRHAADFKLGKLRRMIERELHPELNRVNATVARVAQASRL
jgi:hypothetical protein